MPLVIPNLDSRTFEDLVTEVRRRIPTATPEWTDLNESDPGIALAELFAFMSDQLLYQINQVPNKGLITFLKMVGAELQPAAPAVADVTLTPNAAGSAQATFSLSAATEIKTSGPPPGQKSAVVFETLEPVTILNGTLVDLVYEDCTLDYTSLQAANKSLTQSFQPFGSTATTADHFFLVFDLDVAASPAVWPSGTFNLRVNIAGSTDVGEPPVSEVFADVPPRLQWAYATGTVTNLDGSQSLVFTPFDSITDSTEELTRSGYLQLQFSLATAAAFIEAPDDSTLEPDLFRGYFVLRVSINSDDAYADTGAPTLQTVRLNTVPASAVQTVTGEALGGSSGLPFQQFQLAHAPVVPNSTEIVVDEVSEGGGGAVQWQEVDDLFAYGAEDRVYELVPATGEILFGNGVFGKIPPPDDGSIPGGNITAEAYQFGGGSSGNVGAGTLTNVTLVDTGLPSFSATNVLAADGGSDEEPVAQGVARAPAVVRSRYRAVTATDFEALAKATPGVRISRASALANTRPGCDVGASPGSVTVILVPYAPYEDSIQSPILVQPYVAAAVLRYLDGRRLVTTEVFAESATFREVVVQVTVFVDPRSSISATQAAVVAALDQYFHALVGGDDGEGWPFGGTIYFSRVFQRIVDVPGVVRADAVGISLDGGAFAVCADVPIGGGNLLYSGQHLVVAKAST